MKKIFLVCLFLLGHNSFAEIPEVSPWVMTAKEDFKDATKVQQRAILDFYIKSNPYGKFLQSLYLDKDDSGLAFLNPQLVHKLYQFNQKGSEANCYWTTMFGLGVVGLPERFMDFPEYMQLINRHFRPLGQGEELQAGDVIRLRRPRGGMETHSVIFVGRVKGTESMNLVVSKNGAMDGPYMLMSLGELQLRVYPSSSVAGVYRKLP